MGYVGQDAQETKLRLLAADADDVSLHTVSRAPGSRPSRILVNLNHVMQIAHIEIGSTMPGVVTRTAFPTIPPTTEYELTRLERMPEKLIHALA